jgi:uncharacterized protein (TIGR02300 family)
MTPSKKPAKPKAKAAAAPKNPARTPAPAKPAAQAAAPRADAARKRAPEPPAKAAPKAKPARKEAAPARKAPARGEAARGAARATGVAGTRSDLGVKYVCFQCNAKFYDLNKPEPLCPKCGADQRQRPKVEAKAKSAAAGQRRPVTRPMVPLLEDEEEDDVIVDEELDLGLDGVEESPEDFSDEEEPEEEEPSDG